jgi:hypothetical protein
MDAKSRNTWGKRQELTEPELEAECDKFFGALVVPKEWKHKGYDRCLDGETVVSVGAIYLDTRTRNFNVRFYRVFLNIYSLMGGMVVKSPKQLNNGSQGEQRRCVISNKKVEALNEFIYDEYHRLEREHKYWKFRQPITRKRYDQRAGNKDY